MNIPCLVNGEWSDQISVFDRGVSYGDGLFETIAVCQRRLPLWHRHVQRLVTGCRRLAMEAPDQLLLEHEVSKILKKEFSDGTIKITLTRGPGQRGYRPDAGAQPTRIISFFQEKARATTYRQKGIALRLCQTRLGKSTVAGLKHLNRVEQVIAQAEWSSQDDYQEGLMLDYDGRVIEGTMSNIFIVREDEITTPDLRDCGVEGVLRACIIDMAKNNDMPIRIADHSIDELKNASEVFMTNSSIRIWPVRKFEGVSWSVPGKLTSKLMSLLDKELSTSGIQF